MNLEWREQLSVGNAIIDADHKNLINLINATQLALDKADKEAFAGATEKLANYAQQHFSREEKIAQAAGYEEVNRLHQDHELLTKQLLRARREFEVAGDWSESIVSNFMRFLRA